MLIVLFFQYTFMCPATKKKKEKKRNERKFKKATSSTTFYFHFDVFFVREMIQIQFGYVKTVRRKRILEFILNFTNPIIYDVNVSFMFISFVHCCAGVVFCTETKHLRSVCLVFFVIVVAVFVHIFSF